MDKKMFFYILIGSVIVAIPLLIYKSQDIKRKYKAEVFYEVSQFDKAQNDFVTENDIKELPQPVQKYLRYVGVVGKEKVKNFRISGDGEFKLAPDKEWLKSSFEQYNFFENPRRIYFMKVKMFGVPVVGLHSYKDAKATMKIKAGGLITVADAKGEIMNKAETVTVLNDMCLVAPATLIDKRIKWETINPLTVKATFDNKGIKISAELYFNDKGELINFVSSDRYMTSTGASYQNAKWSTPVRDYKDINGFKLASYGEAIWSLPEGDYCYGRFNMKEIEYNCDEYK